MMMNDRDRRSVLVTGASGFLGSHVAATLRAEGWPVAALVRPSSPRAVLERLGVELRPGDVTDAAALAAAVEGCWAVVHCAALVRDWGDRDRIWEVNVEGMRRTLEAARRASLERFVEISTLGVYGMGHHDGTDELTPRRPSGDPYADSKLRAEELAEEYHRRHGLPVIILRPGIIYGPRDTNFLPRLLELLRAGRFRYVDHGANRQTLVYVVDVARAVARALETPAAVGRIYNLAPTRPLTTREFVEAVARVAGLPPPTGSMPRVLAWAYSYTEGLLLPLLGGQHPPLAGPTTMRFSALSRHFDTSRAQRDLGFRETLDLAQSLRVSLEHDT